MWSRHPSRRLIGPAAAWDCPPFCRGPHLIQHRRWRLAGGLDLAAAADNSAHESSCDHGGHFGAEYRCDFGLEVTPRLLQSRQHLLLRLADKEQCQIGGLVAEAGG